MELECRPHSLDRIELRMKLWKKIDDVMLARALVVLLDQLTACTLLLLAGSLAAMRGADWCNTQALHT